MRTDTARRSAATLAGFAALLGLAAGCEPRNAFVAPPPPEVTATNPVRKPVTTYLTYTGTTRAIETVDLRARVKGFLQAKHYREGGSVQKGDLLLEIDEKPFRATLSQAQAKLAEANASVVRAEKSKMREVAQAQLALDQAQAVLSRIEERRQRNLLSRQTASQQDVDTAEANRKKYEAQVDADAASLDQSKSDFEVNVLAAKAQVKQAEAAVDSASIDLGYCKIYAPVSGRISRSLVDEGNLVGDGQATLLATILQEDQVYAYMSVSETDLLRFLRQVSEGKRPDYRKVSIPLELALQGEQGFPHKGSVQYSDPGVDPSTGTVQARGIFDNPDGRIVSGLFVRVRIALDTLPSALCIPETAIGRDQAGSFVLLAVDDADKKGKVVRKQKVELGTATEDGERVVEGGLKPDDLVIVNGLQRARDGAPVRLHRRDAASDSPSPPRAPTAQPKA